MLVQMRPQNVNQLLIRIKKLAEMTHVLVALVKNINIVVV